MKYFWELKKKKNNFLNIKRIEPHILKWGGGGGGKQTWVGFAPGNKIEDI